MDINITSGIVTLIIVGIWMYLVYQSSQLKRYSTIMFYTLMLTPILSFLYPLANDFIVKDSITESMFYTPITLIVGISLIGFWVFTLKDASDNDDINWFILLFLIPPLALVYWFIK